MKVSYEALKQEFKRVLLARNVRERHCGRMCNYVC